MKHVDEFIDGETYGASGMVDYARWILNHARLPASLNAAFSPFMGMHRLFCTYQGKRYRCTGASRLGDVWLAEDFERQRGYDHRVEIDLCKDWGDKP